MMISSPGGSHISPSVKSLTLELRSQNGVAVVCYSVEEHPLLLKIIITKCDKTKKLVRRAAMYPILKFQTGHPDLIFKVGIIVASK